MAAKARKPAKRNSRSSRRKTTNSRFSKRVNLLSLMAGVAMGLLALAVFFFYVCRPFLIRFSGAEAEPEYFKDYNVRGIDISHYQRKVRWDLLQKAELSSFPIRFVIIKATEGGDHLDKRFPENFCNARKYGFVRGAYHFFNPNTDGVQQAAYYLSQVKLTAGDMPPILDVEQRGSKSLEAFQQEVERWLLYVEKETGVAPILYTNTSFRYHYLSDERFARYPFWVAHYNMRRLRYKGDWVMWQYSEHGRINGIDHDVDLNLFNGEFADLERLLIPAQASTTRPS